MPSRSSSGAQTNVARTAGLVAQSAAIGWSTGGASAGYFESRGLLMRDAAIFFESTA
jgi:hypothetical protein